jgi:hypothetical protein
MIDGITEQALIEPTSTLVPFSDSTSPGIAVIALLIKLKRPARHDREEHEEGGHGPRCRLNALEKKRPYSSVRRAASSGSTSRCSASMLALFPTSAMTVEPSACAWSSTHHVGHMLERHVSSDVDHTVHHTHTYYL